MSKADKSATRSALKANLFRGPRFFNPRSGSTLEKKTAASSSWWIDAAQPDQRAEFILLAHKRDDTAGWKSNAVPHAVNPSKAYR